MKIRTSYIFQSLIKFTKMEKYSATIMFEILADNEEDAKKQLKAIAKEIDKRNDNRCIPCALIKHVGDFDTKKIELS